MKRMKMKNILNMNEKERQTILKWAGDTGADEGTMASIREVLDDADAVLSTWKMRWRRREEK